ncbi:hypothetical protein KEM56_006608 [Ascosphaera pollenicola]|nr:hypothetical protein KEM56_006608 [Ascosphaera pollenicola]
MASRIEKTIARQQEKIASGAYYESHQQLRVIANRYIKQSNHDAAAEVLTGGALALLHAGSQQGASASGGDLSIMLVRDVYTKAEWECFDDTEEDKKKKNRLIQLLEAFPAEEPTRKRYITEIIQWSSKFGDIETGDPDLHHAIGALFAKENEPYEAEKHLALGNKQSPEILARLEHEWYTHNDPHTAGMYACRAVIPYLLTGSLCNANVALRTFVSELTSSGKAIPVQQISSASSDMRLFPTMPLLNFLELLLITIQRGAQSQDLFRQLARQYASSIEEVDGLESALAHVGEIYFGLQIPKQRNSLMDMMGAMFGGGSSTDGSGKPKKERRRRRGQAAPPTMEVD